MKSKTSCFNPGLAKNMLRRRWPAWLLFAAVMLSYPIMVLNRYHEGAVDLDRILQSSATSLPVLMLVVGVLAAMLISWACCPCCSRSCWPRWWDCFSRF